MVPTDAERRRTRFSIVLAVIACAAMLAVAPWRSAGAEASSHMQMRMGGGMVTAKELRFRNAMRVLWEQHVAWTRLAILSFNGDLPDLGATEARLLRNQTDIGNAVKPFYGNAAGTQLTGLLRRHILVAVDILVDVKAGHQQQLNRDLGRWYANANQIAGFLHRANPHNWPLHALRSMMHRHLKLTTDEAVAELSGKYGASVAAYDQVEREILGMADMLSTGVISQFPHRFS